MEEQHGQFCGIVYTAGSEYMSTDGQQSHALLYIYMLSCA